MQKDSVRQIVQQYLSKWKIIVLFLLVAIVLALIYLRYTPFEYQANAVIKIKDDKNQNKLPELTTLQNYGLFKMDANNVLDEMEIIKSRSIVEKVVKDLKFNVAFFIEGRIQDHEAYSNPPLNINFSASDSIVFKKDTILNVKINSAENFYLFDENYQTPSENNLFSFGKPIDIGFSEIIITPNIGQTAVKIGSKIRIKLTPLKKVTNNYKSRLILESKENSSIIKLSLTDRVKEKAEDFLNRLIEEYNNDVIDDKLAVVSITSDFINNRLEIVSRELGDVDLTAETIQKSNKITDIPTQSSVAIQKESANESQLIATENQIQLVDYLTDYLNENSKASDPLPANIGIIDGSIDVITRQHNELVLQRNRILKNSSEINPIVVNLTNQINALKQNLQQNLNNVKASNEIKLDNLYAESARINSQIYSAPRKEREFRDVKRQQDIKEALYLYLLQKREESAISYGVSSPNAKIVDEAFASPIPVKPKKSLILLAAMVFGISIPIGLIYLMSLLDFKVHSFEDIKDLTDVPHLGDIPKSIAKKGIIEKVDYSPRAEAFRMIRTNLDFFLHKVHNRGKVIFVTSTTSKEGKSFTSINLAASLSYSGKKTLIIETDIRVPNASRYLNVKNEIGVTNFITDESLSFDKIIFQVDKSNDFLFVIPSGTIPPNPAELLMSNRVEELFEKASKNFDYIIVDTAAVGLVTDTLLLTKFADMFIYVVRAEYLDKRQLQILKSMYEDKKLPNMTVVVNNINHKKSYGYGYGYGSGKTKKNIKQRLFS